MQVDRFPNLDSKLCEQIYGNRIEVFVPIFDAAQGIEITWHNFRVLTLIRHKGDEPICGHYVSALCTSLGVLLADDDVPRHQTHMYDMTANEYYLIWLAPTRALQNQRWTMPICRTTAMEKTPDLNDLFGVAFDQS